MSERDSQNIKRTQEQIKKLAAEKGQNPEQVINNLITIADTIQKVSSRGVTDIFIPPSDQLTSKYH